MSDGGESQGGVVRGEYVWIGQKAGGGREMRKKSHANRMTSLKT